MSLFNVYPLFDIEPVKGENVHIYDKNNVKYLDFYGGHAVISIGHSHPKYVKAISEQVANLGFYSNSIQNPLQKELAQKLVKASNCVDYSLFMCNSGAEANENALKLASFHTGNKKVIAFTNGFHGRTSASVATTDNPKIIAPINAQQEVIMLPFGDIEAVKEAVANYKDDLCAVIIDTIQGVGGLDEASTEFYQELDTICKQESIIFIADEVQSGFARTGDFFAFQKHNIQPDIISIAKGMGNGFPVGGVLIHDSIKASFGLLGTTFGGNHFACVATLKVLDVIKEENLLQNVNDMSAYFIEKAQQIPQVKNIKGRGLMLGLEFDFPIADLRKQMIYTEQVFTGSAKNPKLLRILPPLTITKADIDLCFKALENALKTV